MHLFVYGTLLQGLERAALLGQEHCLGPAVTQGRLFDLGDYPGLIKNRDYKVFGELYQINANTLVSLDQEEDYDLGDRLGSLYVREEIYAQPLSTGERLLSQAYFFNRELGGASSIPTGDYRCHLAETQYGTDPEIKAHWYLAFGSNMNPERIQERLGFVPEVGCTGRLQDFRLVFNKLSKHGGVRANILYEQGSTGCPFVAYRISLNDFKPLDRSEGAPGHYYRLVLPFQNTNTGQPELGHVYIANTNQLTHEQDPDPEYLEHLVAGYQAHGFETKELFDR